MLRLLQMGPSKVLTTFFILIQSSWQLLLLELPPLPLHCDSPLLRLLRHVYLHCGIWPPLCKCCTLAPPLSPNLLSLICPLYISSLCPLTTVPRSWLSFCTSCLLSPLTLSGFFNGMLEVFEPGALNYFTFSRSILSTLSAFRNPILTHLSEFLGSLLYALIAPTPGLAFSPLISCTLAAALSFLSGRAYLFLNFLPSLFLRLILTLIM